MQQNQINISIIKAQVYVAVILKGFSKKTEVLKHSKVSKAMNIQAIPATWFTVYK
jgi:hypothetical protein